jgi:hypothetical protein
MSDKTDDWPERIALPALRLQLAELDFFMGCLSEHPAQQMAKGKLMKAEYAIKQAIQILEER